jgi:hypothetical protein
MMRPAFHPNRLRVLLAAGGVMMVAAVAPAGAGAATATYAGGTVTYTAASGEANHVAVQPWGLGLKVTDTGTRGTIASPIAVTAGAGCWQFGSSSVLCSGSATTISANLGDGNDSLDAHMASVALNVSGGTGDDSFDTRNGATDTLVCGGGTDTGNADAADSVAPDCETVLKTAPATIAPAPITDPITDPIVDPIADPVTSTTGPDPSPADDPPTDAPTAANAVPASIPPQTVGVSASGVARVQIVCPPDSGGCSGTVVIDIPQTSAPKRNHKLSATASAARRKPPLRIGKAKFRAKAGSSPVIPVRLSKRGRQRILRGRRSRARITVTSRSAAGRTVVTTQEVTIRPRVAARRSGRRARP